MVPGSRVMMWANFRRGPNISVPAPYDDNSSPYWWYDRIANMAHSLAEHGVTDVLFPNPVKGQSGAYRTGDGYNPTDDYDIGSKNQLGAQIGLTSMRPTRFGTDEQLRRAVAVCRANGINVHLDIVLHQRMGGRSGVYKYVGADGKTLNGRFPKNPGCFSPSSPGDTIPPYVPVDPVPDQANNFPFGNPLAPVNSDPPRYVWNGLIEANDWLFRTTGAQGARLDDMKGMNVGFMKAFMTSGAMKGKFFFGEYASGNPNDLNWWVDQVDGLASAIDFGFHYNRAQKMCNDAGGASFSMTALGNRYNAMIGTNPMRAIPFVESMDSDTNGFATIVDNKALAYALMLAGEGLPMIYIRDYLQEPDCYGLKKVIDNLMWVSRCLANGVSVTRYADAKTFVFERTGHPGLLCALNNDVWNPAWKTVTVQTNFGPNRQIHDYTGRNGNDCWTDANGVATIGIPPGANGTGFGMWSVAGQSQTIKPATHYCRQEFFGAADLDTLPALNGIRRVARIWAGAGTPVLSSLDIDKTGWDSKTLVAYSIYGPNNHKAGGGTADLNSGAPSSAGEATETGWHVISLMGSGLPAAGSPFTLSVDYTASKTLSTAEF